MKRMDVFVAVLWLLGSSITVVGALPEYSLERDQKLAYRVAVEFGSEDEKELRTGVIHYHVRRTTPDSFTLAQTGMLMQTSAPMPGQVLQQLRGRGFLPPLSPFSRPVETTFSRSGDVVQASGSAIDRTVIGYLPELIIHPLRDQESWTHEDQIMLEVTEDEPLTPASPVTGRQLVREVKRQYAAEETTTYRLSREGKDVVNVAHDYKLHTRQKAGDLPRIAITAAGSSQIDAGIPQSGELSGVITFNSPQVTVRVPFKQTYARLSDAEVAAIEREQAQAGDERRAANARIEQLEQKQREGEGPPLTDTQLQALLKQLGDGQMGRREEAAEKLALAQADGERSREVIRALQQHVLGDKSASQYLRLAGMKAVDRWSQAQRAAAGLATVGRSGKPGGKAAPATVTKLRKEFDEGNLTQKFNAIAALGALKDPAAVEQLIDIAAEFRFRSNARKAIEASGRVAAPIVASKMLTHGDWGMRQTAAEILAAIGTENELPALEKAKGDSNGIVKMKANEAIAAIRKRS